MPPANAHLPTEWKWRRYCVFNQYWPRNGWRESRGSETFENEERAGTWRRIKPFMMCLEPELLAPHVYWSPRICMGWEVLPLPISPSANWHSSWLNSSWEHHLWSPLECFSSIFKNGMRKKFLKARVWLAVEAEVPFGRSIWKSSPPVPKYVSKSWVVSNAKTGRGQEFHVFPETGLVGRSALSSSNCFWPVNTYYPVLFRPRSWEFGRAPEKGPRFLGGACALQLALWSTQ